MFLWIRGVFGICVEVGRVWGFSREPHGPYKAFPSKFHRIWSYQLWIWGAGVRYRGLGGWELPPPTPPHPPTLEDWCLMQASKESMNACQRLDTRTNYHLGNPDFSCNHDKLDARGHNKNNCARTHKWNTISNNHARYRYMYIQTRNLSKYQMDVRQNSTRQARWEGIIPWLWKIFEDWCLMIDE